MTKPRIRWTDEPETGDAEGSVGTLEPVMFYIDIVNEADTDLWVLTTKLPGMEREPYRLYRSDRDILKAAAERWLEEFTSSLGAVFPEPAFEFEDDDEPLEVRWAAGRRVRYAHAEAGYPGEQERIADSLTLGEVYTIGWADIGQSRTDLNLFRDGKPAGRFNSVFFEPADDEATAAGTEANDA